MIDTRDALELDRRAEPIEWEGYVKSWTPGDRK
jgi:hypothetical protein